MPTNASNSFDASWQTIETLLDLGKDGKRTQEQIAAINKAALVFYITAWESYVEDLAREAASFVAQHCKSFSKLPKSTRKVIVKKVTPQGFPERPDGPTASGFRPDALADDGWRQLYVDLVNMATTGGAFNTPNTENVSGLFREWLGVEVVPSWNRQKFTAENAADRLDESIRIRGEIVHTGAKPPGINKSWIKTYGTTNIRHIVKSTDQLVATHVNEVCATGPGGAVFG